jgi:Rrf2 family protein
MITKTSLLATRALLYLVKDNQNGAISPRNIALQLGESQSYMAKVLRSLVKAGILRSEHGSRGGVLLNRSQSEITLLSIVEACQGAIAESYCQDIEDLESTCAFHHAAVELRNSIMSVLGRWTLKELAASPRPTRRLPGRVHCVMAAPLITIGADKPSGEAPAVRER